MFYFKVTKPGGDPDIYTSQFIQANEADPQPSDVVISVSPAHFGQIKAANPANVYLRVHPDRHNRDLRQGRLYNEYLKTLTPDEIGKNPVLITITPDEFDAALVTHQE